jgi:hypothetical protein
MLSSELGQGLGAPIVSVRVMYRIGNVNTEYDRVNGVHPLSIPMICMALATMRLRDSALSRLTVRTCVRETKVYIEQCESTRLVQSTE